MSEAPKHESPIPGGGAGAAPPQHSARQGAARSGGPALEAMYQLLLWLIPTLEKLPRSQKFLLGDRLQVEAQGGAGQPDLRHLHPRARGPFSAGG